MPIYTIHNEETEETTDIQVSWNDFEQYLKDNPKIKHVFQPPHIGDPVGLGIKKPDSAFTKYVLGKVKSATPGSTDIGSRRWDINREI